MILRALIAIGAVAVLLCAAALVVVLAMALL
jgi:hypothetical protein